MDNTLQLVQAAQAADPERRRSAFDALIEAYQGLAFHTAYQMLEDRHLAEDAVQEALLIAYLRIEQLRDPQAFPAWLRQIVRTQCDRLIRGKTPSLEPLETRFDLAEDSPSPEALIEAREMREQVRAALQALPDHERAVTEGFYMHGESQRELAERLEVPVTTIKKRLQYSREHLRLLLDELNAVVDEAIARMLNPPKPERQPLYLYNRQTPPDETDY